MISQDTDAELRFLSTAFGAVETPGSRMLDADGDIGHAEVEIGDCAADAGARVVTRPTALAFGEIVARVRDPQGHLWWVHQHVEDVPISELTRRMSEPDAQEAVDYVQRTLRQELQGRG